MKIAYICRSISPTILDVLKLHLGEITCYESRAAFEASAEKYEAVVFSLAFGREAMLDFIHKIRQSSEFFLLPVIGENDGVFTMDAQPFDCQELRRRIESVYQLASELEVNNYVSWENRVLSYFYTRPYLLVSPALDPCKAMFYYYPLAEQFYDGAEDYFFWLEEMVAQNIFSKSALVDRLFCCPFCFSARMKFTDLCPHCGSINIRDEKFVHCFTCGHVAPESNVLKDERLVCPSCRTKLKLIGEDYDRPLENGVCGDCGRYHIDSNLGATCLDCSKSFSSDSLSKRQIHEYKLTDYGRSQIRYGTINSASLIVNELNFVIISHFVFMLDWLIDMQKRYTNDHFGLIVLKITPGSSTSAYDLLLEFARFLRNLFRTTDMCTKLDNSTFVFVFPKTDAAGMEILIRRINEFLASLEVKSNRFAANIAYYTTEKPAVADVNARELIESLAAQL